MVGQNRILCGSSVRRIQNAIIQPADHQWHVVLGGCSDENLFIRGQVRYHIIDTLHQICNLNN